MNLSALFIRRPVATTLLTVGILLSGLCAYNQLPVSPLPQVDFPTIAVSAQLPGGDPETVAATVAAPLERRLGQIADVTEMTSTSSSGSAQIVLQFGLDRDINGAARDVEAGINSARADLPTSLRSNPTYRKVNPADAPILIIALTSKTLTRGQIYNAASNVLEQKLSQINGIGEVIIGGAALPAVRVELNPTALNQYGIGLEDVRAALSSANANSPKGVIEDGSKHYQLYTNDQANVAADYKPLVIAYRNSDTVRLSDVSDVYDGVENIRNAGLSNGKPAVLVILFREPNANILQTVAAVKAALPELEAAMPADIQTTIANDQTPTIRASLNDTQETLLIAVALVTLVVFLFLRDLRTTLIPFVAVPVSIIGTFGTMYLMGYSLDNLSLMALTVSTGFVVDDAIVVVENVARHMEAGMPRRQAALRGAREVGFTIVTMSLSLIAVFIPILLMGGIVGRLFREFAVTLSMAILVSLAISLTTTPMMCAVMLSRHRKTGPKRRTLLDRVVAGYGRSLHWALRHSALVMVVLLGAVAFNVYLYVVIPKGFFPTEDTGRMIGGMRADQDISFQSMQTKLRQMMAIVQHDRAVQDVVGYTGGGSGGGNAQTNTAMVFISLKPLSERPPMTVVMTRLRRALNRVPGARLFLQPTTDIRVGARSSNAAYQYTLQADDSATLYRWAPKLLAVLENSPVLTDVDSDQQQKGLETDLVINRDTMARLGLTIDEVDNTLYDAFGQREVSTIYSAQNQYHVVMEVEPQYWQSPTALNDIYVSTSGGTASGTETTNTVSDAFDQTPPSVVSSTAASVLSLPTASAASTTFADAETSTSSSSSSSSPSSSSGASTSAQNAANNSIADVGSSTASSGAAVATVAETMIPLSAFAHYAPGHVPLAVNHQGDFVASTISFNLAPGKSLSDAVTAINQAMSNLEMPTTIHGSFAGTAATFQQSLKNEPVLVAAALITVYIVLGILYESLVHPLTILSTLPSAGVGALISLMLFHTEFSIIALIGVILLIGIVKKNAIMMIDFALDAERQQNLSPRDAIFQAAMMRFRPIMMTTFSAMLGGLPLALSFGYGSELRRPLGISIFGGLLVSQVLTLYTTPVIYLYLDRFHLVALRRWNAFFPDIASSNDGPTRMPAE
jgi:multidrug efflux pump